MACEIEELIQRLNDMNLQKSSEKIIPILNEINTNINKFDQIELTQPFLSLLKSENHEIRTNVSKCIAELTKTEVQRRKFTQEEILNTLINNLKLLKNIFNMKLTIQICRALGNICYSNDEARNIILHTKGDEILIKLLDIETHCDKTDEIQFIKVRGGLISNYLLGGEILAKRAMDLNIMNKLQKIIDISIKDVEKYEDLLLNTLPTLSILTENVSDLNFDHKLNVQLAQILAASKNSDLAEMCLELLHYQAENDDVKLLLAKQGLCETIYKLLEKYKTLANSSEARALMKLACDLIVLILTGDESMHYLYSTQLLKNMENWLDSNDVDLLTTGVLALGNFARTDKHCLYMVENKVMNKLLDILSRNNGVDDDMRLQHALLSALRNLVIPKPNKSAVIEAGLVQTILPMLAIHQPPVVFKLLGTLRMTVDGQEKLALELLQNKALIEQLVHWSRSSDYAGVTGESLRLMAWLIKHSYHAKSTNVSKGSSSKDNSIISQNKNTLTAMIINEASLSAFVKTDGAVQSMVNMLTSQHLVMQNEALIALSILTAVFLCKNDYKINLDDLFVKCELGKKLVEFIKRSSDTMTKEIVENLQKFTNLLKISDKLIAHLEENNISEVLNSLPILTEYCTL